MKKELIQELFEKFEDACYDLDGLECWSGREMQDILGYSDWRNFLNTIQKAAISCKNSGEDISNHFVEVNKMIIKCQKPGSSLFSNITVRYPLDFL